MICNLQVVSDLSQPVILRAHFTVIADNILLRHTARPDGGRQYKHKGSTSILGICAELLRLTCGLGATACNDDNVLEAILVQRHPSKADRLFTLIMRQVLSLSIASLHNDTCHTTLNKSIETLLTDTLRVTRMFAPEQAARHETL
jgi:hypothetical protein